MDLLFGETIEERFERFRAFMYKYVRDEAGYPIEIKDHQKPWFYHIELNMYALILAPREHGKSTVDKGYILWRICEDTNLRVLIASHKEELSDEFARFIQTYLLQSELQQEYNFEKGTPWRIGEAYFRSNPDRVYSHPFMRTVAKEAGIIGSRFDILIMDDLFDTKDIDNEKKRRRLESWINKALYPALDHVKKGRPVKRKWIVLGTRKHLEDWYSKLIEMPHWKYKVDQLYQEINGKKIYLWPEKFNENVEMELRAQMEPDEFAMEFMNQPIAAEGLRFKREWIEPFFYKSWQTEVPERFRETYIGIDPSMGSKTERATYMGLVVVVFDKRPSKQDIYVVDMIRSKLSLAEQEDIIKAKIAEWQPIAAMIENESANKIFSEQMMRQLPILQPVIYRGWGASTNLRGTSDVSKIGRIENISGWLFKKGKIRLKDPVLSPMSKIFIEEEYLQFPEGKLDLMDALNMAVDRIDLRARITKFDVWMY